LHFTEDTYTSDGLVAVNDRLVDAQQMKVQMFRYTQAWDLQPGCNCLHSKELGKGE